VRSKEFLFPGWRLFAAIQHIFPKIADFLTPCRLLITVYFLFKIIDKSPFFVV